MIKLQSHRSRFTMKAAFGLLLALVAAGAVSVASSAGSTQYVHRHGQLHVTKECSQYTGAAGSFCTITGSNLDAIRPGAKVFYRSTAVGTSLDSDLVLDSGHGDRAFGHVTLDFVTATGVVTFSGGTGHLRGFRARTVVSYDAKNNLWHWDGTYSFGWPGDDNG
jgi:hypothetical protein